jgi:hypothetical protein
VDAIHYLILRIVLFLVFAIITAPLTLALVWVYKFINTHKQYEGFLWLLLPIGYAYIFSIPLLAHRVAQQMVSENCSFAKAVGFAFYDLRLRLAFLPLIGYWFEPASGSRERNRDDA